MAKSRKKAAEPQPSTPTHSTTTPREQFTEPAEQPKAPSPEPSADLTLQTTSALEQPKPETAQPQHTANAQQSLLSNPQDDLPRQQGVPNPFPADLVSLTDTNDGPKMRFYRERRNPSAGIWEDTNAIQFDMKPEDDVLQKLRDANWKYNSQHKVWKKPLGEHRATEEIGNQQLFTELANSIREKGGLEPVRAIGKGIG